MSRSPLHLRYVEFLNRKHVCQVAITLLFCFATLTLVAQTPTFNLSVSPTNRTIYASPGTLYHANFTVSISPVNGFSGTVSLSSHCTVEDANGNSGSGCVAPYYSSSFGTQTITGGSGSTILYVNIEHPYCFEEWIYTVRVYATSGGIGKWQDVTIDVVPDC